MKHYIIISLFNGIYKLFLRIIQLQQLHLIIERFYLLKSFRILNNILHIIHLLQKTLVKPLVINIIQCEHFLHKIITLRFQNNMHFTLTSSITFSHLEFSKRTNQILKIILIKRKAMHIQIIFDILLLQHRYIIKLQEKTIFIFQIIRFAILTSKHKAFIKNNILFLQILELYKLILVLLRTKLKILLINKKNELLFRNNLIFKKTKTKQQHHHQPNENFWSHYTLLRLQKNKLKDVK